MTLREKQSAFLLDFAKLIIFAYEQGYELSSGELLRTKSQQYLYFEGYNLMKIGSDLKLAKTKPVSKTMNSKHLLKLAGDLNLFKDGELVSDRKSFKPLADYWRALDKKNESGFDWGWDYSHFQRNL